MSEHLISQSLLDRMDAHRDRMDGINAVGGTPTTLPKHVDPETGHIYFDFEDRYKLKSEDLNKCEFCPSAKVSKDYANALIKRCSYILVRPELFFVWNHVEDERTLGEILFDIREGQEEEKEGEELEAEKGEWNQMSIGQQGLGGRAGNRQIEVISEGIVKLDIQYEQTASLQNNKQHNISSQSQQIPQKAAKGLGDVGVIESSKDSLLMSSKGQQSSLHKSKISPNPFFMDIASSFRLSSYTKHQGSADRNEKSVGKEENSKQYERRKKEDRSHQEEREESYERILTSSMLERDSS